MNIDVIFNTLYEAKKQIRIAKRELKNADDSTLAKQIRTQLQEATNQLDSVEDALENSLRE
ncbi:hypothetical protein ACFQ4J_06600 [Laceyella tengchongensis]|jgi:ferritin-like metal-binding protein YciE